MKVESAWVNSSDMLVKSAKTDIEPVNRSTTFYASVHGSGIHQGNRIKSKTSDGMMIGLFSDGSNFIVAVVGDNASELLNSAMDELEDDAFSTDIQDFMDMLYDAL